MKLNPGERSILGMFNHWNDAEAALQELQEAGFQEAAIDRIGEMSLEPGVDLRNPARGASSLSDQVMSSPGGNIGGDEGILLGADPAVSGLSGDLRQETPFLLTVVTSEERVQEARRVIRKHRGEA